MESVETEMQAAKAKYGTFNSTHEIYAVLQEEVDEFWDLVKMKSEPDKPYFGMKGEETRRQRMILELRQVVAVALRAAQELENNEVKFI